MYQSGRAGDEAKKHKSPAKSGRVGITVIYYWILSWFNFILGSNFFPFWGGMVKYEETTDNEIGTKDKLNHNLYTLASKLH